MAAKNVAIWDDREEELEALLARLNEIFQGGDTWKVKPYAKDEISMAVDDLSTHNNKNEFGDLSPALLALAEVDVLCIDYDLRMLKDHPWLTAEGLAGLVRAFTDCPCVIVLNRPPRIAFDLSMISSWDGPGDQQVPQSVILRKEFWDSRSVVGNSESFKPWSWLELRLARERANKQRIQLREMNFEREDVFQVIGLAPSAMERLSQRALSSLSSIVRSGEPKLTLKEFLLHGARSLFPETLDKLAYADRNVDQSIHETACRVISYELGRWTREQLFAAQDVLVDLPHLIVRAPWILGKGKMSSLEEWNLALKDSGNLYAANPWLQKHRFTGEHWLDREAFTWPTIQADGDFNAGAQLLHEEDAPEFIFLEDRSCFVVADEGEDYLADFGNLWDRRYVSKKHDETVELQYGPLARFAL